MNHCTNADRSTSENERVSALREQRGGGVFNSVTSSVMFSNSPGCPCYGENRQIRFGSAFDTVRR